MEVRSLWAPVTEVPAAGAPRPKTRGKVRNRSASPVLPGAGLGCPPALIFAACGPSLSLHPQTPRGTAELLSSTGGGVCLPPALGPERPARTELRGAQLRPPACHVGWEDGQDLPRPSQTHFKPQLPGFDFSPTCSGVTRPPTSLHAATGCLAAGPAAEQDVWGSAEG